MRSNFNAHDEAFKTVPADLRLVTYRLYTVYMCADSIDMQRHAMRETVTREGERETNRREMHKAKSIGLRESKICDEC